MKLTPKTWTIAFAGFLYSTVVPAIISEGLKLGLPPSIVLAVLIAPLPITGMFYASLKSGIKPKKRRN